jgi:hypothetical protein
MKIRLIDTFNEYEEETFGTCEICMSTGLVNYTTFVFEVDGERREIEGWRWDGAYLDEIYIENLADFAHWLSQREFPKDTELETFWDLQDLTNEYNYGEEEE